MSKYSVLLRADGGLNIGMGHLTRIAGLAEECLRRDFDPVLLTRAAPNVEIDCIFPDQVDVRTLPEACSREMDRKTTVERIREFHPEFVVTDLCNAHFIPDPDGYRTYLSALRDVSERLVVIDDLHTFSIPADLVVNPNYGAAERSYPADEETRYLTGPDYFIFRDTFIEQRSESPPPTPDNAENLVVTLGGSDQQDVTGTVCRGIEELEPSPDVEVISGLSEDRLRDQQRESSPSNWTFHSFVEDMADVLARADLAVTAGGLTKYETALLGVPSAALSQVDHQHRIMQEFEKAGTCVYLGPAASVSVEQIREELQGLINNRSHREQMSESGRTLLDGKGKIRIVQEMKQIA